MPYWELALRRSPPSTLTTQTHPSGKSYMRYEEVFNGAGGTGVGRLNHVSFHFVLYLRDWTVYSAVNVHVSHDHMRPQPASIQIPLSVFMSLCVSGTSGHSPWSAWSRVGGGGLWQRPRPGWFPGQVHMHFHVSCVPMLNLALSPFICQLSWPVWKSTFSVPF